MVHVYRTGRGLNLRTARTARAAAGSSTGADPETPKGGAEGRTSGRTSGTKRRAREGISPDDTPDLQRGDRGRKQPKRLELSPGGDGAFRKDKVEARLEVSFEERVPDFNYIASARVTARALEKLGCGRKRCKGKLKTFGVRLKQASPAPTFSMVCTTCYATFKSNLGETTKVRNSAWCGTEGDDDDDEDEGDGEQQFRRQKRCVHQLQLVLGALFAGNTFKSYQEQVIALNVNHLGEQAFSNTVYFIALFVRAATDKSIELMQYVMVRYGKIDDMITTGNDTLPISQP